MKITIIDEKGQHFSIADAYTILVHEPDEKDEKISHVIIEVEEGIKHSKDSERIKDLLKGRPGINLKIDKEK